jgi:hypothetical protein
MKNRQAFRLFHGLVMVFYLIMYLTGVYFVDYKWSLPLKHRQLGLLVFVLIVLCFLLINRRGITKILKHHLKWQGGNPTFKLFKLSVMLLFTHFILALVTGGLMILGLNLYPYHRLSKFLVPILVGFHIVMQVIRKQKKHG